MIRVGNAPCSWGTIEGFDNSPIPYRQMLDELVATGYTGTELGDLGYMPTDPDALRAELADRDLVMLGAYEGVELRRPGAATDARDRVGRIGTLLRAAAELDDRAPYFILADQNNDDPVRTRNAGRTTPEMSLSDDAWRVFAANAAEVAAYVRDAHGLATLFHPHCAAFVERPDEIAIFLDLTARAGIDLVFDTGHYTYGAATPDDGSTALAGLERFWGRVAYVHFKDCHPGVAERARAEAWDYRTAVGSGLFCELGHGSIDFASIVDFLRRNGYDDWITVEQDVLPGMGTPKESARRNREFLRGFGL